MNIQAILNVVGVLLVLLSGLLLAPLGVSMYYNHSVLEGYISETTAFSLTFVGGLTTGLIFWKLFPSGIEKLRDREGFAIVASSWIAMSAFGALPLYLTGICPNYIDALFESASGFTTTGASILVDIDAVPHGILFWRNLMQWVGGMGIILLSLAIFPMLGIGSFHLFKAEIPGGSTVEQMQPRLAETAKILWKTYLALTIIEIIALLFAGLDLFDAVCHTFSTVATGGFSPHNGSVGIFDNIYIEAIIILFMFFGGINFALHSQIVRGNFAGVLKNPEFISPGLKGLYVWESSEEKNPDPQDGKKKIGVQITPLKELFDSYKDKGTIIVRKIHSNLLTNDKLKKHTHLKDVEHIFKLFLVAGKRLKPF